MVLDQLHVPREGPALLLADGTALSHAELVCESGRVAAVLESAGVRPGNVVVIAAANSPTFVIALLGCWRAGAVAAPVPPSVTGREADRLLTVARPTALLVQSGSRLRPRPMLTSGSAADVAGLPDLQLVLPGDGADPALLDAEDALILFTSGSTGEPKGVVLTERNVTAGIGAVVDTFGIGPEDLSVALLPWTHGHGLIGQLLSSIAAGASIAVPASSNLVESGVFRREHPPTWLTMVPPHLTVICEAASALTDRLPKLRLLRTASAALNTSLAHRAESIFDCPVAEAYGMTETSHQAAANRPDYGSRRLGTVGRATGVRIRLGEAMGGELEVHGDAVFKEYLGRSDLTRQAMSADGWYRTGDLGEIAPDGTVRLLGRVSELINRGGFKVSPVEVEEVVSAHPGVLECLAVAIDDSILGQDVAVLVVPRKGQSTPVRELKSYCREQLSADKQPGRFHLVDELPRLPNGKPNRRFAGPFHSAQPVGSGRRKP